MKKLFISLLAACFIFTACKPEAKSGAEPEESVPVFQNADEAKSRIEPEEPVLVFQSVGEVINMTDRQLLAQTLLCWLNDPWTINKDCIAIPDFYFPEDFGFPLDENETWYEVTFSASSREDAEEKVPAYFEEYTDIAARQLEYVGENEYYYQFRFPWNNKEQGFGRTIVFKDGVLAQTIETWSTTDKWYDYILAKDRETIRKILDLYIFFGWNLWDHRIIYIDFTETDEFYYYNIYHVEVCIVSEPIPSNDDQIALYVWKEILTVSKSDGIIGYKPRERIKQFNMLEKDWREINGLQ